MTRSLPLLLLPLLPLLLKRNPGKGTEITEIDMENMAAIVLRYLRALLSGPDLNPTTKWARVSLLLSVENYHMQVRSSRTRTRASCRLF
jgi:hypothetical protein